MKYKIIGEIVSKKNTWQKNKWGSIYQSKQKEINDIIYQLKTQKKHETTIENDIYLLATIRGSNRRDAINELETIFDCLQASGIIRNDRLIKEFKVKKIITKRNIGASLIIYPLKT